MGFLKLIEGSEEQDHVKPTIKMLGENPLTVRPNQKYSDPGATCTDALGNDITQSLLNIREPEIDGPGTYLAAYSCSDKHGHLASPKYRKIIVEVGKICFSDVVNGLF
jgi:hypothetical protein